MRQRIVTARMGIAVISMMIAVGVAQAKPQIPALPEIDDAMAAAHPGLAKKRAGLIAERKKLLDQTNRHNAQCSAVTEGSTAEKSCLAAYAKLEAAINQHIGASKAYIADYDAARKSGPTAAVIAHTDASVVDARNVPSGLPPAVEKAIDGAYAKSPPGVRERVRKGFQAVMERDWKVAKAWFQDALNREPANAHLQRLVALSEPPAPNHRAATTPPNQTLTSLNANADKMTADEVSAALVDLLYEQANADFAKKKGRNQQP